MWLISCYLPCSSLFSNHIAGSTQQWEISIYMGEWDGLYFLFFFGFVFCFFLAFFMYLDFIWAHKNVEKELCQCLAILTSLLVNNAIVSDVLLPCFVKFRWILTIGKSEVHASYDRKHTKTSLCLNFHAEQICIKSSEKQLVSIDESLIEEDYLLCNVRNPTGLWIKLWSKNLYGFITSHNRTFNDHFQSFCAINGYKMRRNNYGGLQKSN